LQVTRDRVRGARPGPGGADYARTAGHPEQAHPVACSSDLHSSRHWQVLPAEPGRGTADSRRKEQGRDRRRHMAGSEPRERKGGLNRRELLLGAVSGAALARETGAKEKKMEKLWVFVGTSTGGASKGIYRFRFDPPTGACGPVELAAEAAN